MDVIVDSLGLPSFTIEVGLWDTVLTIKQKIEMSQGYPVSRQVIFYKAKVLQNHFDITECDLSHNCHLKLFFTPSDNTDQVPQTVQPPSSSSSAAASASASASVSSNPIEVFANATQSWPLSPRRNNDQVETQVTLNSSNEFLGVQETPAMVDGKNEYDQMLNQTDSSAMVRSNYDESQALKEIESLLGAEDNLAPLRIGSSSNNKNQPLATSDKGKEIIVIPDSPVKKKIKTNPVKMIVMVRPFKENWIIPVEVNADENVVELRKELVKLQERGQIELSEGKYILTHKQVPLIEDQSFRSNNLVDGDTIIIIHGFLGPHSSTTRV